MATSLTGLDTYKSPLYKSPMDDDLAKLRLDQKKKRETLTSGYGTTSSDLISKYDPKTGELMGGYEYDLANLRKKIMGGLQGATDTGLGKLNDLATSTRAGLSSSTNAGLNDLSNVAGATKTALSSGVSDLETKLAAQRAGQSQKLNDLYELGITVPESFMTEQNQMADLQRKKAASEANKFETEQGKKWLQNLSGRNFDPNSGIGIQATGEYIQKPIAESMADLETELALQNLKAQQGYRDTLMGYKRGDILDLNKQEKDDMLLTAGMTRDDIKSMSDMEKDIALQRLQYGREDIKDMANFEKDIATKGLEYGREDVKTGADMERQDMTTIQDQKLNNELNKYNLSKDDFEKGAAEDRTDLLTKMGYDREDYVADSEEERAKRLEDYKQKLEKDYNAEWLPEGFTSPEQLEIYLNDEGLYNKLFSSSSSSGMNLKQSEIKSIYTAIDNLRKAGGPGIEIANQLESKINEKLASERKEQ